MKPSNSVKYYSLHLLALLLGLGGSIMAQPAESTNAAPQTAAVQGPTRVGFVDVELVMDNSRAIRAVLNEMDERMTEKARAIDLQEREFRRLRFELDRQERLLSPEERDRRRQQLIDLQEEITERRFDLDRDFAAAERAIEPVLERIYLVVADLAEAEGIDLVLRGEVVIYGSRTADLTEKVITELDKRIEEVRRAFEEGGRREGASGARMPLAPSTAPLVPTPPPGESQDEAESEEPPVGPMGRRGDSRVLLPEEDAAP